jgi:hypothetical protein
MKNSPIPWILLHSCREVSGSKLVPPSVRYCSRSLVPNFPYPNKQQPPKAHNHTTFGMFELRSRSWLAVFSTVLAVIVEANNNIPLVRIIEEDLTTRVPLWNLWIITPVKKLLSTSSNLLIVQEPDIKFILRKRSTKIAAKVTN